MAILKATRTQVLSPAARTLYGVAKRWRHALLRAKLRLRIERIAGDAIVALRQYAYYRPPGERRICPACGGRSIRHLAPLPYTRPQDYEWKIGFISGCKQCGLLFANPLPSAGALERLYSPDGGWGRHRQEEHEKPVTRARLARFFAPLVPDFDPMHPPPGATVLDFGCGLGGMLDTLQDLGWITYGVDPATKVAFRRHRELSAVPDVPTFDLVVLHHVLEHITDPLSVLRQLAQATRPGGVLLVSVPNFGGINEHADLKYCLRSNTHVLAYSRSCFEWLTAAAGFTVVSFDDGQGDATSQRLVVLARRTTREGASRPSAPLEDARRTLERYLRTHDPERAPSRLWPVRVRTAVLNRKRRGRLWTD